MPKQRHDGKAKARWQRTLWNGRTPYNSQVDFALFTLLSIDDKGAQRRNLRGEILLSKRIADGLGSVPEAQEEPRAFSGIFCSERYRNGIRCIAEVSRDRGICEFHRKGKLREVKCTSFTKEGLQCKKTSRMKYSQQEEWGYLCKDHKNGMLQRGHLYRSGMPASLLARVEVGPSILSKDLEDQKEHDDLSFELSQRKEIIITADEFNDLTRYLDSSIKKRLRTVICSYFQFLSSRVGRSRKGDPELNEYLKEGYVYIMECNEHDMANTSIQLLVSKLAIQEIF
ncbi:MAG: hypothetical protein JOS17DRAFT_778331 [Linnemannia elongata]|nr:MAG: hypothetical protein JOS17DRAFT_778331 [Linnemannia elongata]